MYSTQDFPGIRPQRFKGGRTHLKPVDSIGRDFNLAVEEFKGKKHFEFDATPVMHYKP